MILRTLARYLLRNDPIFIKLDKMLDNPQNWIKNKTYTIIYKSTGLSLWMANGFWFFGIYKPYEVDFSFLLKLALWHKAKKVVKALTKKEYEEILSCIN